MVTTQADMTLKMASIRVTVKRLCVASVIVLFCISFTSAFQAQNSEFNFGQDSRHHLIEDAVSAQRQSYEDDFRLGVIDRENLSWQTLNNKIKTATKNLQEYGIKKKQNKDRSQFPKVKFSSHQSNIFENADIVNDPQQHPYFHMYDQKTKPALLHSSSSGSGKYFIPGEAASPFTLDTIAGQLSYPSQILANKSIIFHTFDNRSAFLECLWTSESSLQAIASSPESVHFVFMSPSIAAKEDAYWMQQQINNVLKQMQDKSKISKDSVACLQARLHFVTRPTYELGNWIPGVLMEWTCEDHGCGLTQSVFNVTTGDKSSLIILKRLDARYDWVQSPAMFKSPRVISLAGDGCTSSRDVANKIALVVDGNCSFFTKVKNMQDSSAVGIIIYSKPGEPVQDLNCEGAECDTYLSIPATMIPYSQELLDSCKTGAVNVTFQTTPSENFYFAIDAQGLLAEMGWLLFPSFQFFVWQAQWFDYKTELLMNLTAEVTVVPIINDTIMQGHTGIVQNVALPSLQDASRIELEAFLSCPGTRDESCAPWDHIMQLYVCCDEGSPLCGMELGRWITPFRRRLGHWLTDVTPLAPLITSQTCNFTMKLDAWWAQPWKPSLNIRIHPGGSPDSRPQEILPLFRGGTFNESYNSQRKPINFTLPGGTDKVVLYAVITGHGSDNNGCGEFCPTSHHFIVNSHHNFINFTNAGTPMGCAERTPTGIEPNEHGTWLYGRDGWCNGREVDPWVVDVTSQVDMASSNTIKYFGWFQGTDPHPVGQPGNIVMYSYLVIYK